MRNYLTYFDVNYLSRGLALYRSLEREAGEFHLWIVAFDEKAFAILQKLELHSATVIALATVENDDLRRVKSGRSRGEYCWTCTPATLLHVLTNHPELIDITYLDADLLFFSSPQSIYDAAEGSSVILTEHRWMDGFDLPRESGRFAVQFVTFANDEVGLSALKWWYERCIEWCYARFEDGKFGDQKYLDDWPSRFARVHVDQSPGVGVGPWNCAQCDITERDGRFFVNGSPLVFYHFHAMRMFLSSHIHLYGYYPVPKIVRQRIYPEYRQALLSAEREIQRFEPKFKAGRVVPERLPRDLRRALSFIRHTVRELREGRYLW